MLFRSLTLLIITFCFASCDALTDSSQKQTDYLIFGHFYGQCVGDECVVNFKVTDGGDLYKDENDAYAGVGDFSFKKLPSENFELAEEIRSSIPQKLLSSESQTFGCPDCADQGGVLIQVSEDGNEKKWKIDQDKDNIPAYLHDFVDEVNATIREIQQHNK
jgi:hypothetical protein